MISDEGRDAAEAQGPAQAHGHAHRWALWAVLAMLVVSLYVLSVGPVNAYSLRANWSYETWKRVEFYYTPVRWLGGSGPPAHWLYRYEVWCNEKWPGPPPDPFQTWLFNERHEFTGWK